MLGIRRLKNRRGQSFIEYMLVAIAVIAAVVVYTQAGGGFRTSIDGIGTEASSAIDTVSAKIGALSVSAQ